MLIKVYEGEILRLIRKAAADEFGLKETDLRGEWEQNDEGALEINILRKKESDE